MQYSLFIIEYHIILLLILYNILIMILTQIFTNSKLIFHKMFEDQNLCLWVQLFPIISLIILFRIIHIKSTPPFFHFIFLFKYLQLIQNVDFISYYFSYLLKINKIIISTMSINYVKTFTSPINNSTSKQMHAFSRADRFEPTRRSQCRKQFYETTRGALDKRSASFGFGTKTTFQNREGNPEPSKYTRHNQFTINKVKDKGYKFGNDTNRSLLSNPKQLRKFPGPGSYVSIDEKHKTGFGTSFSNVKFSMRGKYEDPLTQHGNQLGPGHYPIQNPISARGSYYNTKYQNSFCQKTGKDERFPKQKVESPGPGAYYGNEKLNINGTGTYNQSRFRTTKGNSFSLSHRPSPAKARQAPDPGTYHRFSDFALQNKTWSKQY